ncbi:MAG: pentapeptide repeat-containing protein [Rhodospirillales bacterium]|nr:pentapeptide repeat-containing protein [Rhodospirillales bacterium]
MESPSYDLTGASLIKASITGANLEHALFVNAGTYFCGAESSDDLPGKYKK